MTALLFTPGGRVVVSVAIVLSVTVLGVLGRVDAPLVAFAYGLVLPSPMLSHRRSDRA